MKHIVSSDLPTLDEIHGQQVAKRALVIAATGHHNLLLGGSPGADGEGPGRPTASPFKD